MLLSEYGSTEKKFVRVLFGSDLSFADKRFYPRTSKTLKYKYATPCSGSDVCTCYYDTSDGTKGGIMIFIGTSTSSIVRGSSFALASFSLECVGTGYDSSTSSFHSLFQDEANSKMLLAYVTDLENNPSIFSITEISGYSGFSGAR